MPLASFTGFLNQTEVSQAYVAADCLVLPSDHGETWGLVVNEALASGLPCLVSDACGCAEELAGQAGSFRSSDSGSLASKLKDFASRGNNLVQPPTISQSVESIVRAYHEMFANSSAGMSRIDRVTTEVSVSRSRRSPLRMTTGTKR